MAPTFALIIPIGLLIGLFVAAWVQFGWGDGIDPSEWRMARVWRSRRNGSPRG